MSGIAFNAIVRNESANIRRLLESVCPHVDVVIIADTGSSDDTIKIIHEVCKKHNVAHEVHHCVFQNFSQARNYALDCAYNSPNEFEYILLGDADMELIAGMSGAGETVLSQAYAPAYYMKQEAGGLSYNNVRMISRDLGARYIGVTHEYLNIGDVVPEMMTQAWWIDHATGANRGDKFKRDIRLLLEDMRTDKNNPRSWFYLANSYMEDKQYVKAINAFNKRISLGDWPEEIWHSQLAKGRCYRALGKRELFIEAMIKAADMNPNRAEPLYDLAKYFREKGENRASTIFAKAAMALPKPTLDNALFIEQWVYDWASEWEFSVCAYYDPRERAAGFTACDHISLHAGAPFDIVAQAKANLYHYTPLLVDVAPSWREERIDSCTGYGFVPPRGYSATNPSVTVRGNETLAVIRCVNYTITESGHYDMHGDTAIRTRNFLYNLTTKQSTEIIMPADWPVPAWDQVIGWEDMRLFVSLNGNGKLGVSATVRERNPEGWCEIWVGFINEATGELHWPIPILPKERRHEKNWAPVTLGESVRFKYRPTQLIDFQGNIENTPAAANLRLDDLSGGSQLIRYNGGWLALVHEAGAQPNGQRWYRHRFVWYDACLVPSRVSKPFSLHHKGIEFAAGLAANPHDDTLMISYGVSDRAAWIGYIRRDEVRDLLWTSGHE
jgi:glycosyltransferase involved in cell wall biosynthesis